jgi:subtilase family serine protease
MRPSAPCDRRRVPCDAGRRWFGVLLFWAAWLIGHPGWAQETVLIREIQSREYAVFLGHEPTPTFKEMVSREVGLAISTGPADPLAQVVSREVGLVMTDAPPPPRVQRLSIVNSPTGESVVVRWTDYNPWAVGDIARFDIYLSDDGPFASVVGRTPIASVGGETTEITLTGLTAYRDHFIAVVPVDALGAYDATVNYGAAYVLSSEIVSREWAVHVASGDPDELGQLVSREVGVILSTPEAPPRITELVVETSATGETVRLDWSGYNQWAVGDIARFDVYLADDAPFTTVAGRTPYRSVPAESVSLQLTGLTPWTDHYFAVVPVDAAGNFEATVEYSAAYVLTSQIVSREFGVFMETGPAEPYAQVISREFGVVAPDGQAPAPVTGVGSGFVAETSRTALGAVDLDWTAYNEAAQLDVVRYRIYVGNAFFESVTGLTPFAYVPAGTQRHTLTGLSGLAILHFAVVAEDVTGEFDPVVRSHSAQASIAGVGEVTHLAVRSEATALEFSWEAPTDAGAFLAGYRVYLGDATEPVDLAASVLSWRAENLTRAQGYSFRILTRDVFGHVSSGTSLLAATWLENPTGVGLTAIGETARLFWSGSTPAALVGRYAVYRGDGAFGDLTGLTPVGTTTGTTYDLGTLDAVNGKHFAVATVNVSDGFDPAVVSVSASKQRQTIDFPTPALGGLAIPLTATASSGLAVQFGASPSDVAVVEGTVLKVLRGGTVTVTARQAGNEDYWPAESSWTVRLPPVIRNFLANGVELTPETTLAAMFVDFGVTVDDREGPNRVQFFRRAEGTTDWTLWATDEQGGNGWGARVSLVPIPPGAYDVRALVTTASGAWNERIVRVTLDPVLLPDLAAVALTAPATAHAGQTVAVGWTVTNHGPGAVSGPWKTRFLLSRDPTGAGAVDRGLVTAEGPLAPGETRVQSASPIVPADWFGPAYLVVEVDAQSQVSEADEGNNRTVAASPLQVLAPDLVADRLTAPRTLTLGEVLEARWTVTNRGSAPTSVAWRDRIWLSRSAVTREGAFELGSVAGPSESLAPSAGYEAGGSFTVPLASSLPAGAYFVWVEADGDRAQPEVSDANNRVTAPIDLTLPPVPDLAVTELIAPAVARPGATVMLTWTVTNRGVVGAQGVWRESLSVSNAAQGPRELTLLTSTNDLLPGGRIERSASVVLPAGTSGGEAVFRVIVDASGEVVESDETNNDRVASASTQVPRVLGLSLEWAAVREDQAEPVRAVVTRNGDPAAALPVTITVSDRGELVASLPSLGSDGAGARYALTIPAGQAAAAFELVAVPDQAVDGDQSVGVGAAAEGYEGADATLRVLDADRPRLSLTATTTRVTEGGTLAVQVTRDVVTAEPVTVNLVSSSPGQLSPPAVVTIPGGAATVGFMVLAVDDVNAEPPGAYTLTASAAGFHDGSLGLAVDDNDLAPLTVALSVRSVGEGAGNAALAMTVTRTPSGPGPLALEPFASDPAAVVLPLQIVIPAGQASRSFPVGIVDDGLVNGTRTIRLGAYALAAGTGVRLAESPTEALEILDDDGPALRLAVARKLVPEGLPAATEVTVTRNTPPDAALAVLLATSDATEARVPAGITLPIGETSATFALESVADGVQDGNQTVTLRASAPGFAEGVDTVVVSDVDLPDLVVESITLPAAATPGQRVAVAFRIANQGVGVSDQAVLNRVHLSRDPAVGDDVLAAQSQVTSRLEPGQTIDRTEMITLPMEAGRFWVVVETDAGQAVGEILENNNTAISAAAIEIEPDYAAWVATEVDSDLAGTPVPLHGGATNRLGAPVSHVPVTVHVRVRGTERRLSATTDATGLFALEFEPLPGEGGNYALFATHPATASVPVQDNFVLIGFRPLPARQALVVTEGGARTASVELQNLADVALLEVAAEVVEQPAGLGVSLELAAVAASVRAGGGASPGGRRELLSTRRNPSAPTRAAALRTGVVRAPAEGQARGLHAVPARLLGDGGPTLPALGSLMLNASIAAATGEGSGLVKLRVTTAEGAAQEVEIAVRVEPLKPRLVANPPSLEAAMVVGGQAVVEFDVVNLGGRASGPVTVALPDLPWMAVASPNPVDELPPGGDQPRHPAALAVGGSAARTVHGQPGGELGRFGRRGALPLPGGQRGSGRPVRGRGGRIHLLRRGRTPRGGSPGRGPGKLHPGGGRLGGDRRPRPVLGARAAGGLLRPRGDGRQTHLLPCHPALAGGRGERGARFPPARNRHLQLDRRTHHHRGPLPRHHRHDLRNHGPGAGGHGGTERDRPGDARGRGDPLRTSDHESRAHRREQRPPPVPHGSALGIHAVAGRTRHPAGADGSQHPVDGPPSGAVARARIRRPGNGRQRGRRGPLRAGRPGPLGPDLPGRQHLRRRYRDAQRPVWLRRDLVADRRRRRRRLGGARL